MRLAPTSVSSRASAATALLVSRSASLRSSSSRVCWRVRSVSRVFGSLKLFRKRGHAVAVGAGIVAPVGEFVARLGEGLRGFGLLGPCAAATRPCASATAGIGALRSGARFLCGKGCLAPAGEQQDAPSAALNLLGELGIGVSACLACRFNGDICASSPAIRVFQPGKVRLGAAQLAFRRP